MNVNIRWVKSRSQAKKKKNTEDAYLRWYTADGKQPQKRLKAVFRYTGRLDASQKRHNDNMNIEIEEYLNRKKKEIRQGLLDVKSFDKQIETFVEYGKKYASKLDIKADSKSAYRQALTFFEEYFGKHKTFNEITDDDVIALRVHMRDNGRSRYGRPYALNTINTYLNRLSLIQDDALKNPNVLCKTNPFEKYGQVKIDKQTKGEYVSASEYALLDYTICKSQGIAKAFMFSILSGLRKSDVETMVWGDIAKDEQGWHTYKAMVKGGQLIRVSITPMMLDLLGKRKGDYARIIQWNYSNLQIGDLYYWLHTTYPKKEIGQQKNRSGIKGLTFHSARASFITNLLDAGINPFRVQKYVGHKDLKTTMSYYRGKSEMHQKDLLKMDDMYKKEITGEKAKELLEV